jgi:hypothetical protein
VATRADITAKLAGSLTPEQACDARARAWSYAFECFDRHTKKRGRLLDKSGPDDARKDQDAGTYPHCT